LNKVKIHKYYLAEVPKQLRTLAQIVARMFYQPEHTAIIDVLVHHRWYYFLSMACKILYVLTLQYKRRGTDRAATAGWQTSKHPI